MIMPDKLAVLHVFITNNCKYCVVQDPLQFHLECPWEHSSLSHNCLQFNAFIWGQMSLSCLNAFRTEKKCRTYLFNVRRIFNATKYEVYSFWSLPLRRKRKKIFLVLQAAAALTKADTVGHGPGEENAGETPHICWLTARKAVRDVKKQGVHPSDYSFLPRFIDSIVLL